MPFLGVRAEEPVREGDLGALQADNAGSISVGCAVRAPAEGSPEKRLVSLRLILGRGEMAPKRAPYAKRSVWYVVIALAAIVVIGFAAAGYEINHLRTEFDGLNAQVQSINHIVNILYSALLKLGQRSP